MLRFSILLRRRADLSRVEFLRYWREQHAPLVKALSSDLGIRRYVQIHTLSPDELAVAGLPPEAENTYDGLAEVWFDGAAEALARTPQAKAARRQLRVDEEKFIDVATSVSWWATSFVVVDERSGD